MNTIDDSDFIDSALELNRFEPIDYFSRLGFSSVFYKGAEKAKETKLEKEHAKIATEKFELWEKDFEPLIHEFALQNEELNTESAQKYSTGSAGSSVSANFGKTEDRLGLNLNASGVNPNSGKSKTTKAGLIDAQGVASGENQTRTAIELEDQYVQGLGNVSAMGRGDATTAQTGMLGLAQLSANKAANDAADAWNSESATKQAVGFGLGTAANAWSSPKTTDDPFNAKKNVDYSKEAANEFDW